MIRLRALALAGTVAALGFSGDVSAQHTGGGTANVAAGAVLEDASTGLQHTVQLSGGESPTAGIGFVQLFLSGGGLQVCTVNGGGPLTPGQPVPTPNCGQAGGQLVAIDKCSATFVAHGSAHIDAPHTPYLGSVTIEMRLTRTNKPQADGDLEVTLHAPGQDVRLKGKVTGNVAISTCPF